MQPSTAGKMRVFIAGATGAIGRQLVPQLMRAGHEVTAITRAPEKALQLREMGATPITCDIFDSVKLARILSEARPDAVINQLTDLPQRLSPRKLQVAYAGNNRVRTQGTANLLKASQQAGVRRFLLQSAAYWYDPHGKRLKTENASLYVDAPTPIGPAVRVMKEAEESVTEMKDIEAVVLRYGFFYGPGTWYAGNGDVGRQVRQWRYPMIGDGESVFSFIHVEDAASATVAALESGNCGVYNIVDDEPAPAREWLPVYARALHARRPIRVPTMLARMAAGSAVVEWMSGLCGASNSKIVAEIGWRPKYSTWRTGFLEGMG